MNSISSQLSEKIDSFAAKLDGWTTPDRLKMMAQLITTEKPELVVELGVFGGRSFIAQAMALKENGEGLIVGVDPWRKAAAVEGENEANVKWWSTIDIEAIHRQAMAAIWDNQLEQHAVIIRSESQHCFQLFDGIDILNIDANHSEIASCRDVRMYLPRVRRGGHIWLDDCDWATTHKAQLLVEEQCEVIMNQGHWKLYLKK